MNQNQTFNFSDDFEKKMLRVLGTSNSSPLPDPDIYKLAYGRPRENPLRRPRLENVHTARAHKYGISHLGKKHWYQDLKHSLIAGSFAPG